jgi:transposase InsO family protein
VSLLLANVKQTKKSHDGTHLRRRRSSRPNNAKLDAEDHTVQTTQNSLKFTSHAMLHWGAERGINLHFIQPGKPTQNANIESLNGKIRDELFNMHRFMTIFEARRKAADWQRDYNDVRPHSALGYRTPREFAEEFKITQLSQLSAA